MYYQSPDWATVADQEGYRRLARSLAETGRFTRFPESERFIPEVIRTPGYPLFVAAVYTVFGTSQIAVATAQTALFALLVLLVYFIARQCASDRRRGRGGSSDGALSDVPLLRRARHDRAVDDGDAHAGCRCGIPRVSIRRDPRLSGHRIALRHHRAEPPGLRVAALRHGRHGRGHRARAEGPSTRRHSAVGVGARRVSS